jgi:hypothetical protein
MAVWTNRVAADADDGDYAEGGGGTWDAAIGETYPWGETFQVKRDDGSSDSWWGGLRFTNVTIPAGSTINSATLTIDITAVGSINNSQSRMTVFADVGSNRQNALSGSHHPKSGWTNSTASVWINNLAVEVRAITITSIIDEVVGLGGWASGDNICLSIDPEVNGNDTYWSTTVADFDADVTTHAELSINYDAPSGVFLPFFPKRENILIRL